MACLYFVCNYSHVVVFIWSLFSDSECRRRRKKRNIGGEINYFTRKVSASQQIFLKISTSFPAVSVSCWLYLEPSHAGWMLHFQEWWAGAASEKKKRRHAVCKPKSTQFKFVFVISNHYTLHTCSISFLALQSSEICCAFWKKHFFVIKTRIALFSLRRLHQMVRSIHRQFKEVYLSENPFK